jgi:Spy/CpxP family protein refolding chaperone
MRKSKLALLVAALFAVTAMSAVVYARDANDMSGSMMGGGMMGKGMMGGGQMMGMMTGHCGDMMRGDRGSGRPNEQWRDGRFPAPNDHN